MELIGSTRATDLFATQWEELCLNWVPWHLEVVVSLATIVLGFWIPCTIYFAIDIFFPKFAARHKIQSDPKRYPSSGQIWMLIGHAVYICALDLTGQVVLTYLTNFKPLFSVNSSLPSVRQMLVHWSYAMLAREILAYYAHRALHHPMFYATFHKKHHSFTAPIAFAALYTTVTEHVVADVIPIVAPLALYSAYVEPVHILTFQAFLLTLYLIGTAEHSGLDFAQPTVSEFHDLHHEKFTVNYGTLHFMDWFHGTDQVGWDQKKMNKAEKDPRKTTPHVGFDLFSTPSTVLKTVSSS